MEKIEQTNKTKQKKIDELAIYLPTESIDSERRLLVSIQR
jgi:hypothetical protein